MVHQALMGARALQVWGAVDGAVQRVKQLACSRRRGGGRRGQVQGVAVYVQAQ